MISSGLVDLSKLLKQATVRKHIVLQLIAQQRDAGHPDYLNIDMAQVKEQANQLSASNEPTIPNGLAEFFSNEDGEETFSRCRQSRDSC